MCDKSSFHGNIYEIPEICVDNFTVMNKKAYFLSHCHTDHTQGLFSVGFLKNLRDNDACIYTSHVSAVIIDHESDGGDIMNYIKVLKLESKTITLAIDDEKQKYLNVKMIPAGHCFGSVMFLFQIQNQTILYTGDFRINPENISAYGQLHKNSLPININTMYVDTTFQNVDYENFPLRKDSIKMLLNYIERWLSGDNDNRIALHTSACYGYEYVFNEIYKVMNMKTYISKRLWLLYSKFDSIKGITNDASETKIHLCDKKIRMTIDHSECLPNHRQNHRYLNIKFSAARHRSLGDDISPIDKQNGDVVYVCFATHCSSQELNYFVNYFAPDKVIGFREPFVPKVGLKRTSSYEFVPTRCKKICKNNEFVNKIDASVIRDLL